MNEADVKRWAKRLERVLKTPPPGVWLFAEGNKLHIMRYGEDGKRILRGTGMDTRAVVHTCDKKIEVDGGAW